MRAPAQACARANIHQPLRAVNAALGRSSWSAHMIERVEFLLSALIGAALGLLTKGRLARLGDLDLRHNRLLWIAVAMQVSLYVLPPQPAGIAIRWTFVLASFALTGLWLIANTINRPVRLRLTLGLIAAGWTLNFTVIAANHGMPVSTAAIRHAGLGSNIRVTEGHLYKHVAETTRSQLTVLDDHIPENVPTHNVLSLGDVIMLLGITLTIAAATHSPRRQVANADAPAASVVNSL